MNRPQWVQSVTTVQAELYRMSKMFEKLVENTLDAKLWKQAQDMKARCCNLGMRYMSLGNEDALYPEGNSRLSTHQGRGIISKS